MSYFYFKEKPPKDRSRPYVVARFDEATKKNKVESRKATDVLARKRVNYLNGGQVPQS